MGIFDKKEKVTITTIPAVRVGGGGSSGGGRSNLSSAPPVHQNIFNRFGGFTKRFGRNLVKPNYGFAPNVTIVAGTFPLSPAGGVATGAGLLRGAGKAAIGLKNVFQRAVANPFAGTTLKGGLAKIGGRALGAFTALEAFSLSKSAITGMPYNPIPSKAKLKDIAAFGINPIGAVAGLFAGGGIAGTKKFVDIFKKPIEPPNIPDYTPEITTPNQIFNFGSPPSGTVTPSFSAPSFSVSTGGGGNEAALFALIAALGLGGGYLLGRKKRKRKKARYKKRGRHK